MPEPEAQIVDIDVSAEMEASFLEYAYSVIYSRALPDARDGLKPVQRRIVYTMSDMGLRPDRAHVKSSRVVGEVMGKLHPHGDQAIYDALVRMAQSFSLRLPLVDGHGNFGSLDDGPAASRYTEARLAPASLAMTADLGEDVVDFVPNYDNKLQQPSVLPSAIPNLLVNGASGIAVGMATNMAPHNLIEVVSAARHLLANPKATLDDLMKFVPGPDLPSGGKIVGLEGIRQAYETGKGAFRTRAAARIEKVTAKRQGIVVTELPYTVGPERVIEKIKDGVTSKKLQGIAAVTDLTDRHHGLRLVIEIRTGFSPEAVLEQLYKLTPLEEAFSINNVALVDGEPRTLGLKELLRVWVEHRIDVTRRRSEYRLKARRDRLHLVDGLLVAILDIDDVIQIIRTSDDSAAAKERLMTAFDLSTVQAEYILELRLRRLTKFSRLELENEKAQLMAEIAELEEILSSEAALQAVVGREMDAVAAEHGTPRRTILLADAGASAISLASAPGATAPSTGSSRKAAPANLEIADTPCHALLSTTGLVARTSDDHPVARDGRRSPHDALRSVVTSTVRSDIGVLTSQGRVLKLSLLEVPSLPATDGPPSLSGGAPVRELVMLERNEEPVALVPLDGQTVVALGTRQGVVKRVAPEPTPGREAWDVISLKDGDAVVGAAPAPDHLELVLITSDAQLLHFPASAVRPQGRSAGGMTGIKLGAGTSVAAFHVVDPQVDNHVVTISGSSDGLPGTQPGAAKVTPFTEYPGKGRATGGVRAHRFLKGEDALLAAWVGPAPARAASGAGQPVELPEANGRRDGSGVPLSTPVDGIG